MRPATIAASLVLILLSPAAAPGQTRANTYEDPEHGYSASFIKAGR